MCIAARLDSAALDLDTLGLMARHPRATASTQALFSAALVKWARDRVQLVTRRMVSFTAADRDDLVQEFMLRCLTRHLPRWEPAMTPLSAYLYRRLQGDVIDQLRRRITREKRVGAVDPDTLPSCACHVVNARSCAARSMAKAPATSPPACACMLQRSRANAPQRSARCAPSSPPPLEAGFMKTASINDEGRGA